MRQNIMKLLGIGFIALLTVSFTSNPDSSKAEVEKPKWYTWEEAMEANAKEPRTIMVDIYTSWCGWCKRMDKATFQDPKVAKVLNEKFYAVKLDAEMREEVVFNNHTFKYFPNAGRRGVHELAYSLLDGSMSYPSIVFLNEKMERIMISKGYKNADQFMVEMEYTAGKHYKNQNLEEFKRSANP